MPDLTPEAHQTLAATAQRHGVSTEAALTVLQALASGGGAMAQFNHPELGGAGQWSRGGMIMVGDMFNQGLKHRVDALCSELASQIPKFGTPALGTGAPAGDWWPEGLGMPASSGAQNDFRYAYFPAARRLAIQQNGRLTLYDTGDHRIFGVSQQQGGGMQAPLFSSDMGNVRLADLKPVDTTAAPHAAPSHVAPSQAAPAHDAGPSSPPASDALALIERLAGLRQKGILNEEEFAAKKAELLARL